MKSELSTTSHSHRQCSEVTGQAFQFGDLGMRSPVEGCCRWGEVVACVTVVGRVSDSDLYGLPDLPGPETVLSGIYFYFVLLNVVSGVT